MFKTIVYFEDKDLSTFPGISVYNHNFLDLPNRELGISKLARADKSVLTSAEYSSKKVTIKLMICGSDKEDTEDKYIALIGHLQNTNGTLRLREGSSDINYTASTLQSIGQEYFGHTLKVTLEFVCTDPFGIDNLPTTLVSTTNTLPVITYALTVLGSYRVEPVIRITLTSITDGTGKVLKIKNENTQKGVEITRDWVSGDVLVIDSLEKIVTVNNSMVDFVGTFPDFLPGLKTLGYVDSFTARSVNILAIYNKRV